jgi:hypothetical protein
VEATGCLPRRLTTDSHTENVPVVAGISIVRCRTSPAAPRKARVVELRYFAGLSVEETAQVLGISAEAMMRDWRRARLWLQRDLSAT